MVMRILETEWFEWTRSVVFLYYDMCFICAVLFVNLLYVKHLLYKGISIPLNIKLDLFFRYPDIAVMKKRESDDVPIVPPEDTKHVEYPDEFKPNLFNLDRRDSGESLAIHQRAEHEVDDLLEELNKEKEGRHRPNDKMVGETAPVNREREFHESEVPQDEEGAQIKLVGCWSLSLLAVWLQIGFI